MPSKSGKQHRLMAMVANNPAAAKRLGISQSVGKEFMKADKRKGKKFAGGGSTDAADEERYGKVGAEIRRLDPEAYKNRPKTAEGNLKLLEELRSKAKETSSDSVSDSAVRGRGGRGARPTKTIAEQLDSRPGSGAGFRRMTAALGTSSQRERMRGMGYGADEESDNESPAMRRIRVAREVSGSSRGPRSRYTPVKGMSLAERRMYDADRGMNKGGSVKKYASGGSVSSASKRADGIATKGKTRGKLI